MRTSLLRSALARAGGLVALLTVCPSPALAQRVALRRHERAPDPYPATFTPARVAPDTTRFVRHEPPIAPSIERERAPTAPREAVVSPAPSSPPDPSSAAAPAVREPSRAVPREVLRGHDRGEAPPRPPCNEPLPARSAELAAAPAAHATRGPSDVRERDAREATTLTAPLRERDQIDTTARAQPRHNTRARGVDAAAAPTPPDARSSEIASPRCQLDESAVTVDLREPPRGLATQVTLATHGDDAVALVTVAQPGRAREGLVHRETRLVRWPARGVASVLEAPAFEPDASVALAADGSVLVLAPGRMNVRAGRDGVFPALQARVLDARGRPRGLAVPLADTAGAQIDAAPIALDRGGFIALIGRTVDLDAPAPTEAPARDAGPSRVALWLQRFDSLGNPQGERVSVTDEQSDDALGRYRAGLFVSGTTVSVAYSVATGPRAGAWVRRFALAPDPSDATVASDGAPLRVARGAAWGAGFTDDGAAVLYRSAGRGAPTRLNLARIPRDTNSALDTPRTMGTGWDPSFAFVHGTLLWSNAELTDDARRDEDEPTRVLLAALRPGEPLRVLLPTRDAPSASARRASASLTAPNARAATATPSPTLTRSSVFEDPTALLDADLQPTHNGAVLAWLHPAQSDQPEAQGPRRVSLARVICR